MKYILIFAFLFSTATAQMKVTIRSSTGGAAGGFPTDTSVSINNRINTKLNISDTANIKPRLYAGSNVTIGGTYPNQTISSTGGASVAGSTKQIQYNDGGSLSAIAGFEYEKVEGRIISNQGTSPGFDYGGTSGAPIGKISHFGDNVYFDAVNADAKFRFRTDAYTAPIIGFAKGAIGIGTPNPNTNFAALHIESWGTGKGIVLPGLTKAERDAMNLTGIPTGGRLMIYQTDNTPGLRVYNGTNWIRYTETID